MRASYARSSILRVLRTLFVSLFLLRRRFHKARLSLAFKDPLSSSRGGGSGGVRVRVCEEPEPLRVVEQAGTAEQHDHVRMLDVLRAWARTARWKGGLSTKRVAEVIFGIFNHFF